MSNKKQTRRELQELQQFVLHRKTENIRNELYEYMIMRVIYDHASEDGSISRDGLIYHLEKDYHLSEIPQLHITNAISKLTSNGSISQINNKLKLSLQKKEEIRSNAYDDEKLRETVMKNLRDTIFQKIKDINSQQVDHIITNFQDLLGATFARYGIQLARIFTNKQSGIDSLKNYIGFQEMYQKLIVNAIPERFRMDLDKMFNEFFFKPSEELSRYFFAMAQSYVLLEILNVDPDLQKMQEIAWSKKQIYLDTNVVIALLFEGNDLNYSINTLLQYTKELGATLIVSKRTSLEYEKWLEECRRANSKFQPSGRLVNLLADSNCEDIFMKTYSKSLERMPSLEINEFSQKYESYDKTLKAKYSIIVEEDYDDTIEQTPIADKLKTKIMEYSQRKTSPVASHDVYNILKVREMREKIKSNEVGPNVWFLTNDHSLSKAEKDVFGEINIPASITTEIWLQVISPFISPQLAIKDASTAFSKLMSSNFTSHKIDLKDFENLLSVFTDESEYTNEQLRAFIGDSFIREKLREYRNTIEKGEEVKLENIKPLMTHVQKIVKDEYEKKIKESDIQHKDAIKKVEGKMEKLAEDVKSLTDEKKVVEKKTRLLKIIIGLIIGFSVLDIVIFFILGMVANLPLYVVIGAEIALMGGVESTIIFKLPNLLEHFKHDDD